MISWGRVARNILKTIIFTIVFPGTIALYIPYRLRGPNAHIIPALAIFGVEFLLAGAAVYLWCAWDFATFGRGTPLPLDAPKQLVARGLYRSVRNPMYLGVLLVIFGQALSYGLLDMLLYGLGVALAFHLFVILYEEPALKRKFGDSYKQYLEAVPRWIPRRAATGARAK